MLKSSAGFHKTTFWPIKKQNCSYLIPATVAYTSPLFTVYRCCALHALFADQFSNRIQAQVVGMGVGIDIKKMEEDEIYPKIQLVLNNLR